jgi:hypothetical protein
MQERKNDALKDLTPIRSGEAYVSTKIENS